MPLHTHQSTANRIRCDQRYTLKYPASISKSTLVEENISESQVLSNDIAIVSQHNTEDTHTIISDESLGEIEAVNNANQSKSEYKNIRELIFVSNDINNDFGWAKIADLDVIMMKSNGYINATRMCRDISTKTGSKKPYRQWTITNKARELISELFPTGLKYSILINSGSLKVIEGTYVHPNLIPHITTWASPKFAVRMNEKITEYFSIKMYNQTKSVSKDELIEEVQPVLNEVIDNTTYAQNGLVSAQNNKLLKQNNGLIKRNIAIMHKLDAISSRQVVPTGDPLDKPQFVVFSNNIDPGKCKAVDKPSSYTASRVMARGLKARVTKHKLKYPKATILISIHSNPNTVNLWKRIKKDLTDSGRIMPHGGYNFESLVAESVLKREIIRIHNERFKYAE